MLNIPNNKQVAPNLSYFLDFARFTAAFLVMVGHLRGAFFLPYDELEPASHHLINYFLFFITRIGHECVIVFFILSGYLVGGNLLIDVIHKKADWKKYFIDRITRMWVVLIPVLLLGFGMDIYRAAWLNDSFQVQNFDFSTFWGNIFFLQTIFVPIFSSNHPLWSLAYEFWYYIVWPFLLLPFYFKLKKQVAIALAILVLVAFSLIMPHIMVLFPLWVLGAALRFLPTPSVIKKQGSWIISLLLFIGAIYYSNTHHGMVGNYMVGLSFALLLWYQAVNNSFKFFNLNKPIQALAGFSFSLYAVHFSMIFLLRALLNHYSNLNIRLGSANLENWGIYTMVSALLLLLSWVFYYFTERHTYVIRKKIMQFIRPGKF